MNHLTQSGITMTLYSEEEIERIIREEGKGEYEKYCSEAVPALKHILSYVASNISTPVRASSILINAYMELMLSMGVQKKDFEEVMKDITTTYNRKWDRDQQSIIKM